MDDCRPLGQPKSPHCLTKKNPEMTMHTLCLFDLESGFVHLESFSTCTNDALTDPHCHQYSIQVHLRFGSRIVNFAIFGTFFFNKILKLISLL